MTLTGLRNVAHRVDLYTVREELLGSLDGVEGGSLTLQNSDSVKASGSLSVTLTQEIDWLGVRVMPVHIINGIDYPLGMYIPSVPQERHTATATSVDVKLLDKLTILDQVKQERPFTVLKDTNVITAVRSLIDLAGEKAVAITPSTATTRTDQTWDANTSTLRIINDLLGSAGFYSLACDRLGNYTTSPYVLPADRPVARIMYDDRQSIYTSNFGVEEDLYSIPNKITCVSTATQSTPALTSIATNTDPDSRFSYPRRGIWIPQRVDNLEVTSQAVLDAEAKKRLVEATTAAMTLSLTHAYVPLALNDVIEFRNVKADLHVRATCMSQNISLNPTELMSATYRRVVTL